MTRKMTVGAAAAAFFGTILAASAASGVVWNAETTNSWFDAEIANIATSTAKVNLLPGDGWENPTSGDAWATNQTIVFDTEVSDSLKYNPADSGPVALVNVQMIVDPNASMPAVTGLENAQAALSVVTNDTNGGSLEWIGLTKVNDGLTWVTLSGNNPTAGATYDVQIAVDNHASDSKRIRYAVKSAGEATYAILTCDGVAAEGGWLTNPQSDKDGVDKVAFAGAGTIKSLVGTNIVETLATVESTTDRLGYDFTNGTVTAVVSVPSGDPSGKTAVLKVKKLDGSIWTSDAKNVSDSPLVWDISGLTQGQGGLDSGGAYSYTVEILTNGVSCGESKSGTFVAANWLDGDYWFAAKNDGTTTNGYFVGTEFDSTSMKWPVLTNAQFVVEDKMAGNGKLMQVDTSYSFETFIDTESLDRLEDAVGGIVAVSNGASASWYAFTGSNVVNAVNGWQALAGGVDPSVGVSYVIRAEFDFKSTSKRVRYAVSNDSGSSFNQFTLNGNEWIALAAPSNGLSSVGMSGKGSVGSIYATLANTAVATNSVGTKFDTLWEAVKVANGGTITLLTNATLKPEGVTGGKFPFKIKGGDYILDKSGVPGAWKVVEKGGVLYLMRPAATYIFF